MKPGHKFVFGGDAGDKGDGTIRVIKTLVRMKQHYPDNVVLILGNRDVNKMRLTSELVNLDPKFHPAPYWVNNGISFESWCKKNEIEFSLFHKLSWLLECTFGSKGDQERRRKELASIRKDPYKIDCEISEEELLQITDDEVIRSYIESVKSEKENRPIVHHTSF